MKYVDTTIVELYLDGSKIKLLVQNFHPFKVHPVYRVDKGKSVRESNFPQTV